MKQVLLVSIIEIADEEEDYLELNEKVKKGLLTICVSLKNMKSFSKEETEKS